MEDIDRFLRNFTINEALSASVDTDAPDNQNQGALQNQDACQDNDGRSVEKAGGHGGSSSSSSAPLDGAISFSCAEEVAQRIAQLYGDEQLADVVFIVCQGQDGPERRFVGHRNIISTWSRPLDRMLCGSFAESNSREVHIRDVEPSAFEAMLKLMYCGNCEITVDNVLAILDVSVRFDVSPLVQFSVQFLQNHTSSEHACRMLEVGVQYGLVKLMDKCIELIVTDDHILESEDFNRLSQSAVIELAKHNSWNMHEDEIYDTLQRWGAANASSVQDHGTLIEPILEHLRYPHMSVDKLKGMTSSNEVPNHLIFDALFFKLHHSEHSGPDDKQLQGRYRPRTGSLLFSWVPTSKVTVNGTSRENARHTSSNGFTGVRGDRRMQHGVYSWIIDIAETQSSWIFVGIAQADDPHDVAWRSTGRMLYCLDSRYFHMGSGQNHPCGDRKICSGDCVRVILDCTRHTLAFGINNEKPLTLFRDLAPVAYVPAVDLRDCGDKVRILSSSPHVRSNQTQQAGWCNSRSPASQQSSPSPHGERGLSPLRRHDVSYPSGGPPLTEQQRQQRRPTSLASDVLTVPQAFDGHSALASVGGGRPGPMSSPAVGSDFAFAIPVVSGDPPARRRDTIASGEVQSQHYPLYAGHYPTPASGPSAAAASSLPGPPPSSSGSGGCGASSSARMSQPRQSQGSQGGASAAAAASSSSPPPPLPPPSAAPVAIQSSVQVSVGPMDRMMERGCAMSSAAPAASSGAIGAGYPSGKGCSVILASSPMQSRRAAAEGASSASSSVAAGSPEESPAPLLEEQYSCGSSPSSRASSPAEAS